MKYLLLLLTFVIGFAIWMTPPPVGVQDAAWKLFAIFVATIFGVITKPLPMGAIAFIGLGAVVLTKTLTFHQAFSFFSNEVVWLIVFAFFVARGFIKTGLGTRISYFFMIMLGKKTLGLAYGVVATDLILAPAIPSSTARSGGVIFPIIESLSTTFGSLPHDPSAMRMGSFLTKVSIQSTNITSAMFLTAMSANPLIAEIASGNSVHISWFSWFVAAVVPGILSLLFVPYFIYLIHPPQVTYTPSAKEFARIGLQEMGSIKPQEWIMLATFALLIFLWIGGSAFGINAAVAALCGLIVLLITDVLTWKDLLKEEGAWETLVWFAVLLMMASELNKLGLTHWFSQWIVSNVQGFAWGPAFFLLSLMYFYSHYLFASNLAHVGAMYATFLTVAIALGTPPALAAYALGFFSSLFGGLTHYASGPAAILFGAGYVNIVSWWRIGLLVSFVNIFIWLIIGGLWWKMLGFW